MANLQKGTFNTIAQGSAEFGGSFPVWSRVDKLYQGGGFLDVADYNAGDVIGAGTMVIFNGAGKEVTIVKATDTDNLEKVNGLIFEDVCIPEGCIHATCAVVKSGRIYADRVASGIPAAVEDNVRLAEIEFVREA